MGEESKKSSDLLTTDEEISSSNDVIDVAKECSKLDAHNEPLLMRSGCGVGVGGSENASLLSPLNPVLLNYHRNNGGALSLHRHKKLMANNTESCEDEIYGFTPLNQNLTELSTFQAASKQNQTNNFASLLPPPPPPPPASVLTPSSMMMINSATLNSNKNFANPIYSFYPDSSTTNAVNDLAAFSGDGPLSARNFFTMADPMSASLKLISKTKGSIAEVSSLYVPKYNVFLTLLLFIFRCLNIGNRRI